MAKEKIEASLKAAKAELADAQDMVVAKSKEAVQTADTYVKENPWQAVGIAARLGLMLVSAS